MTPVKFAAAAIFVLSAATAPLAPAFAQAKAAEQIMIVSGNATAPVTVLGPVSAEHHQKSMFSKVNARDELDKQLRAAAARLGADAVINVDYDMNSPLMSKKGQLAKGTAVKFAAVAPVQVAAAPSPPVVTPAPASVVPPPVALPPVATPPVIAIPAPTPPAAGAPAAPGVIALAEGDVPGGRAYAVLGAVTAAARPQLDKAPKQLLDEDFRAKAKAMGADAVIMIKYDASGATASGVAVKFK